MKEILGLILVIVIIGCLLAHRPTKQEEQELQEFKYRTKLERVEKAKFELDSALHNLQQTSN